MSNEKLRAAHGSGVRKIDGVYERAINAGASDKQAKACAGRWDSSHGQRRTFGQRKPDGTSDKQAKLRKIHNTAARLVDLSREVDASAAYAAQNPTRAAKRRARAMAKLAAKVVHATVVPSRPPIG